MEAIKLTWPGGEHEFALRIVELRALQKNTDAGPEEIFNRLRLGTWKSDDLTQTVRWGLIGAGMDKGQATDLVMSLIDLHPLMQFKLTALAILAHSLLGDMDGNEEPGKSDAGESPASGTSETSTEPEPQ